MCHVRFCRLPTLRTCGRRDYGSPSPILLADEGVSRMQTSLRRYVSLTRTCDREPHRVCYLEMEDTSKYGLWKPAIHNGVGFDGELLVSTTGWVWQYDVRCKKWFEPSKREPKKHTGDVFASHRGRDYRVHRLMAWTFLGAPPTSEHTVDHIAKYNGDLVRERSDNRIENLRWASKREQALNRNKQTPRRDGKPVLVWKVGADEKTAQWYQSALSAARHVGLNAGSVSRTAANPGATTGGYCVKRAPTNEPLKIADDESFREVDGFFVSQYGRALDPQTQSFAFTPKRTKGLTYAYLSKARGDGVRSIATPFHILVARAWPDIVGECPGAEYTVDHINVCEWDNCACNLRWSTPSQQNKNKKPHKATQKNTSAVELRPPESETWLFFETQCDAVRKVNAQFGTNIRQGVLSLSLQMSPNGRTINKGKHKGWSIRAAKPKTPCGA